jgi:hypothetical protein
MNPLMKKFKKTAEQRGFTFEYDRALFMWKLSKNNKPRFYFTKSKFIDQAAYNIAVGACL